MTQQSDTKQYGGKNAEGMTLLRHPSAPLREWVEGRTLGQSGLSGRAEHCDERQADLGAPDH